MSGDNGGQMERGRGGLGRSRRQMEGRGEGGVFGGEEVEHLFANAFFRTKVTSTYLSLTVSQMGQCWRNTKFLLPN